MSPRLEKMEVNEPVVDAMRMSDITANTNPPPAATPFTAAMIGFGTARSHVNIPGTSSVFGRDDEPALRRHRARPRDQPRDRTAARR